MLGVGSPREHKEPGLCSSDLPDHGSLVPTLSNPSIWRQIRLKLLSDQGRGHLCFSKGYLFTEEHPTSWVVRFWVFVRFFFPFVFNQVFVLYDFVSASSILCWHSPPPSTAFSWPPSHLCEYSPPSFLHGIYYPLVYEQVLCRWSHLLCVQDCSGHALSRRQHLLSFIELLPVIWFSQWKPPTFGDAPWTSE